MVALDRVSGIQTPTILILTPWVRMITDYAILAGWKSSALTILVILPWHSHCGTESLEVRELLVRVTLHT